MRLLVDTSVWSLSLRRRRAATLKSDELRLVKVLIDSISDGRVAMIGPIRQELLSGIKEKAQYERLRKHLRSYRDELLETEDYEEAARLYNSWRGRGVQIGPVDTLICTAAIRRGWEVLSHDSDIEVCLEAAKSERGKSAGG